MIVGCNQSFQVGDNDFSNLSFIPDSIMVHNIPKEREENQIDEDDAEGMDDDYT